MVFELRRCTAASNTHFPSSSLSFSHSLSLSLARALSLSLSLALSCSLDFSAPSDPRSTFRSPSGVAIVFWHALPLPPPLHLHLRSITHQAADTVNQKSSKIFFGINRKWMIHRPHDRQYRRDMEGVLLMRERTLSAQLSLRSPLCGCVQAVCDPNSAQFGFQARLPAETIQSVTQTVHSLGSKRDFPRTHHLGHLRCGSR